LAILEVGLVEDGNSFGGHFQFFGYYERVFAEEQANDVSPCCLPRASKRGTEKINHIPKSSLQLLPCDCYARWHGFRTDAAS
jgi:hypothetical protein